MTLFMREPPCGGFPWGTRQNWTLTIYPPAMNSVKADDMTFTVNYTDGTKKNSKLSSDSEGVNRMLQAFNALKAGEVLCLTIPGSTAPAN